MINAIIAKSKNNIIGHENKLPWPHLKEDMKWFQFITSNEIVIMGSNTWKSLPGPLTNRIQVVISRNVIDGVDHSFNLNEKSETQILSFLANRYPDKQIFIIGGTQTYNTFRDHIRRWYITEINHEFNGDTTFDIKLDMPSLTLKECSSNGIDYKIKVYYT